MRRNSEECGGRCVWDGAREASALHGLPRWGLSARFLRRKKTALFPFLVSWPVACLMCPVQRSLVLLLVLVGSGPHVGWGQAADSLASAPDSTLEAPRAVVQRVAAAFAEGNATRLLTPSADRVEITLFGARTFYSNAQALYVLREFFRRHAPHGFRVQDVMEAGTSCFVQGAYEPSRRTSQLQVYVRLGRLKDEDLWRLHEVRVQESAD